MIAQTGASLKIWNIIELMVSLEENIDWVYQYKLENYKDLPE